MSDQLQFRRGTTAENAGFTGADGEVVIDTDKRTVVVHDGVRAGGYPQVNELTLDSRVFLFDDDTSGGSVADAYILTPEANTVRPEQYIDGQYLSFVTNNENTGAATANFNGLGAKDIKKSDGSDPAAGEVDGRVTVIYDLTNDWLELQLFQEFDPDTAKSDERATWHGQNADTEELSDAATITPDFNHIDFEITVTASRTLANPTNLTANQRGVISVINSGGSGEIGAWGTAYKNTPSSFPAIAGAVTEIPYQTRDIGGTVYVVLGGAIKNWNGAS